MSRLAARVYAAVSGRRSAWAVLAAALLVTVGIVLAAPDAPAVPPGATTLPSSAESVRAAALQQRLPSGQVDPAVIVVGRSGGALSAADRSALERLRQAAAPYALGGQVAPAQLSKAGDAAALVVPVRSDATDDQITRTVEGLRAATGQLPDGLRAQVTGGPGFSYDLTKSFDGASASLLLVTVLVVAALLLVTYRSPWLWLVPLAVIAAADQVAAKILAVAARVGGLEVDPATSGIVSVLVFGAGTNYALLVIARYREELRRGEDRHEAMARALSAAVPAVAASASTVALSLLTLLLATLSDNRTLGVAGAIGIVVAVTYATLVLPAALSVCGRGLFWPFVPRPGQPDRALTGTWSRVGAAVARRPRAVIAGSVVVLASLALGALGLTVGLPQDEQLRGKPESVQGQQALAKSFAGGAADPAAVLTTTARADAVAAAARAVRGVSDARVGERSTDGRVAQVDVVLAGTPGSERSDAALRDLRTALDRVDPDAAVGGGIALDYDTRRAADRDTRLVVPAVLLVVALILGLLLRSLVAPVLLIVTVVGSFFAALGASWLAFDRWLQYGGLDTGVPLLAFLFLVALGVDYNIFLTTRAREESLVRGTQRGVVTALAVTGGVITSAGILLASVFAVLGVLPVVTLTQLGVIVGFGVLLDTLLVRSVLVPALVLVVGRRFWWPSELGRGGSAPAPVTETSQTSPAVGLRIRTDGTPA